MAQRSSAPSEWSTARVRKLLKLLAEAYPHAVCALHHQSPYQLLVATILSAQCTDERVNQVTPALFRKYPSPRELASARQSELEALIRSTGFFRAKATNLIGMAKALVDRHGGEIPTQLDDLVQLPGVGRKTANVVLGTAFGIASGVVVDTHVKRIVNLLGLSRASQPEQIERDLMHLLPRKEWINFSHRLIHHGRQVCLARRPKCPSCPLLPVCNRVGLPPLPDSVATTAQGT
uniref:Endonuclease III n=1 Tax=Schlesneria paludicola TaxID=360056 RepID=A0A7C4LN28_9PLAN